jgi:transcriptional regulator with XRE-family HTH domain
MPDAAALIRNARHAAGLTQKELAARLNMTQSAIAKLERPGANPTVDTLDRVLRGTERRLELLAPSWGDFDIDLLRDNLRLTMAERIELADELAAQAHQLRAAMVRRS